MPKTIAASYLRENFAEILNQVLYKKKTFLVSKHNRIIARLSPIDVLGESVSESVSVDEEGRSVKVKPLSGVRRPLPWSGLGQP